mgnify:CR=1 FL=1
MPYYKRYYKSQVVLWIKHFKSVKQPRTLQEAIHYYAVKSAINDTLTLPDGHERMKIVDMCYFKKAKSFIGAAMEVGVSERTAYRWCDDFVRNVEKKAGYI